MLEKEVLNWKNSYCWIVTQNQSEEKLKEYLDELEFLTFTAGGQVVKRFRKNGTTKSKTFVGTGKIEEIHQYVKENEISTLIFDDELLHHSKKNISKVIVECKISTEHTLS
jgi:GTP-binding protein HflX